MEPTIEAEARVDEIHKAKDCQDQAENHESQCEENFNDILTAKALQEFVCILRTINSPNMRQAEYFSTMQHIEKVPVKEIYQLLELSCWVICIVYSPSAKSNIELKAFLFITIP